MSEWNFETLKQMTPAEKASMHDFSPYLETIAGELAAVKDRVRTLVRHWPVDGHFKETILRQLLRRHLPESVLIGTGFIVNTFDASTEADILIVDRNMPTLFKEGELLIVTPESVRAIIEVKTRVQGKAELAVAAKKLAKQKAHVLRHVRCREIWTGLFVYEGTDGHEDILNALGEARAESQQCVDCVAYGGDTFVKYFAVPESEGGQSPSGAWHSFHDPGLAPADFVASLIESLVPPNKDMGSFAWLSRHRGIKKRFYMEAKSSASPVAFAQSSEESRGERAKRRQAGGDVWYFAYGSNLWIDQKQDRTGAIRQGSERPRIATLADHRLAFNKQGASGEVYANIMPHAGDEVVGVVYRCSPSAVETMSEHEGGYERQMITVVMEDGASMEAVTFVAMEKNVVTDSQPDPKYLTRILTGAAQHGLPPEYIEKIKLWARCNEGHS